MLSRCDRRAFVASGFAAFGTSLAGGRPVNAAASAPLEGGVRIFDGSSLRGWHVSRVNHHGTDPGVWARNGELQIGQHPYGVGGVLLTDKTYKNFDLYLEANPDAGCDGGVFLRASEAGNAYQITLDNLGAQPSIGNLIGEARTISRGARNTTTAWRPGQWNALRVRVTGDDAPRIALWINDQPAWDVVQDRSAFFTDKLGGAIGVQSHFNAFWPGGPPPRWTPGGLHRFRNIFIRELA